MKTSLQVNSLINSWTKKKKKMKLTIVNILTFISHHADISTLCCCFRQISERIPNIFKKMNNVYGKENMCLCKKLKYSFDSLWYIISIRARFWNITLQISKYTHIYMHIWYVKLSWVCGQHTKCSMKYEALSDKHVCYYITAIFSFSPFLSLPYHFFSVLWDKF